MAKYKADDILQWGYTKPDGSKGTSIRFVESIDATNYIFSEVKTTHSNIPQQTVGISWIDTNASIYSLKYKVGDTLQWKFGAGEVTECKAIIAIQKDIYDFDGELVQAAWVDANASVCKMPPAPLPPSIFDDPNILYAIIIIIITLIILFVKVRR